MIGLDLILTILFSICINLYGPKITGILFGCSNEYLWAVMSALLPEAFRRLIVFLFIQNDQRKKYPISGAEDIIKKIFVSRAPQDKKITFHPGYEKITTEGCVLTSEF